MHLFVIILLMQNVAPIPSSITPEVTTMSDAELQSLVRSQADTIAALRHQLDWFRRHTRKRKISSQGSLNSLARRSPTGSRSGRAAM